MRHNRYPYRGRSFGAGWVMPLWVAALLLIAAPAPRAPAECDTLEVTKLLASDAKAYDYFGSAVAISGNTAVIGAPYDDHVGGTDAGSAYVFVRSDGVWIQQAKLAASDATEGDLFGMSVALSGDTAVIGACGDAVAGGAFAGSAYVFVCSGAAWTQQAKLTAFDGAAGDFFGLSLAISGDTAAIGAPYDDHGGGTDAGSAYVFVGSGGAWTPQAKLTAADAAAGDLFGISVALLGDTAMIGAQYNDHAGGTNAGSAYVFVRSGGVWAQQANLTASDATESDLFGISVALSGDTAVIGAWGDDHGGRVHAAGSAYVFVQSGGVWTQQSKLTSADAGGGDYFGYSVAISGDTAVIGAWDDDYPGGYDAGSAYVFVRSGAVWTQQSKLIASDAADNDLFGISVAVSGDTAVIGSYADDHAGGSDAGSAYVFDLNCPGTGACCLDYAGGCQLLTEADCLVQGGRFRGVGTTCGGPDVCGCKGDCSCDGIIGLGDINPFVAALTNPEQACSIWNCDINDDGAIDFADINPFVALLAGSK